MEKNPLSILAGKSSQAGQAVVEYILMLVVTVGIVLGGMYQLHDAFKVWADSYFGEYFMCLLETGEMPSLGGQLAGACAQQFAEFSIDQGKPLVGNGIGSGEGGEGGSVDGADGGSSTSDATANSRASTRSAGGGGSTSGRFKVSRRRAGGGSGGGGSDGSSSKKGYTGSNDAINVGSYNSGKRGTERTQVRRFASYRGPSSKQKDDKEKEKTKVKKSVETSAKANRRDLVKVEQRLKKSIEAPEIEELSFGDYIRYLVIAGIIIALILFLGGQALQISKSME